MIENNTPETISRGKQCNVKAKKETENGLNNVIKIIKKGTKQ